MDVSDFVTFLADIQGDLISVGSSLLIVASVFFGYKWVMGYLTGEVK